MIGIIGSLGYVGETPRRLFELAKSVAETGNVQDYQTLKEELEISIGARDGLSEIERKAVSEILSQINYAEIRTGSYLDGFRGLVCLTDKQIKTSNGRETLQQTFGHNFLHLLNYFEKEHEKEEWEDSQRKQRIEIRVICF